MTDLYSIIISNPIIIETLFHLNNNYQINYINSTKRTFNKTCDIIHIYKYLPILKELFINKNINDITYLITETFDNNSIIYEIKLNNHPILDNYDYIYNFRFFIHLYIDEYNKNKINIILKTNKINIIDPNPFNQTIIYFISNYLENEHMNYIKNDIIDKELKQIFLNLNPHSFELNII
jgi:hypothetical protein